MNVYLPTVLFQSINFLVLVVILWRLLFRPLRVHMQGRAQRIADGLVAVETGQREIATMREEVQMELERAGASREETLRAARAQGEAERHLLLENARAAARAERDRLLSTVADKQTQREAEFLRSLTPQLQTLVARIIDELADAASFHRVSCERFAVFLSELPPALCAELAAETSESIELVVAREPIPEVLRLAVARLSMVPTVTRVDPDLLAGAKLIAGEMVLDGSVRGQIARTIGDVS